MASARGTLPRPLDAALTDYLRDVAADPPQASDGLPAYSAAAMASV